MKAKTRIMAAVLAAVFLFHITAFADDEDLYTSQGEIGGAILRYAIPVICGIFNGLYWLGGALAGLIIVYAGIKYITSLDDPGARKKARETLLHAMVGLILLVVAAMLIGVTTGFELEACNVLDRPTVT